MEEDTLLISDRESEEENELRNGELPRDRDRAPLTTKHCHDSVPENPEIHRRARRKLVVAVILVFVFMFAEMIGGILANSLAIATDAAHLLTDFMGFSINLISLIISSRKPTRLFSFGWHRMEVLGAMVSVLLLWIVTGVLVYMAILRVFDQNYLINPTIMLIMAAVGVFFNIIQSLNLVGVHSHGHSHGNQKKQKEPPSLDETDPTHGQTSKSKHESVYEKLNLSSQQDTSYGALSSQSYDVIDDVECDVTGIEMTIVSADTEGDFMDRVMTGDPASKPRDAQSESINVRAALIHVLGDLAQSFGVLIAAIVLFFRPDWKLVDPICTFTFSIVVILTTSTLVKEIVMTLAEAVPARLDHKVIESSLSHIPGVKAVHDLHVWALTSNKTCASVHIALDPEVGPHPFAVVSEAEVILKDIYGLNHVTVQTEEYNDVMITCPSCQVSHDNDLTNKT